MERRHTQMLHLVLSALIIDSVVNAYLLFSGRGGVSIREWYRKFATSAMVMDVASLIIPTFVAIRMSDRLAVQLLVILSIQLCHDLFMAWLVSNVELRQGTVLELWSRYGKELGATILMVDACMLLGTLLLHRIIEQSLTKEWVSYFVVVFVYILTFIVHSL